MSDPEPTREPASGSTGSDSARRGRGSLATLLDRPWHPAATLSLAAAALALSAISLLFPSSPEPASRPLPRPPVPAIETTPAHPTEERADGAAARDREPRDPGRAEDVFSVANEEPLPPVLAATAENAPSDANAVRTAARQELLRAAEEAGTGDGAAEAWLHLALLRRAEGDEAGALEAHRRRDTILAERRARAEFLDQLEAVRETLDERAFVTNSNPPLDAASDGDYKRARVRLYSMLARSGDLSSPLGAIAPDVSMAIADTYRDEALRALEGRKADAPPADARMRDEPEGKK